MHVHRDSSDELEFRFELSDGEIRVEFTLRVGVGRGHPDGAVRRDERKTKGKEGRRRRSAQRFSFLRVRPPFTTQLNRALTLEE